MVLFTPVTLSILVTHSSIFKPMAWVCFDLSYPELMLYLLSGASTRTSRAIWLMLKLMQGLKYMLLTLSLDDIQ